MNKTRVTMPSGPFRIAMLLCVCVPFVASQLCDDNPLANNGIKIVVGPSTSCLKGRTPDMTEIGSCEDDSAHDIQLPFEFKFLDQNYSRNDNGRVFVCSNSYITFGGSSTAFSDFGSRKPAIPSFFVGAADTGMRSVSVGPDALGWRVRYEGWSRSSNAYNCDPALLPTIVWELIFTFNSTMQLCTGFLMENVAGLGAVSDGVSDSLIQKFKLAASTMYTIFPQSGMAGNVRCECDDDPQINAGVKITSRVSSSCMKGRSPDMIDVANCQKARSTSIRLPFSFSFLGRTYGGQNDDVFVGDSSFVTFGGAGDEYYSAFEPDFSHLPALLIGARQNVLKRLSVGPDPLGWRVRYEGWSNHIASTTEIENQLGFKNDFNCYLRSLDWGYSAANVTWELLFLFDGTLQLCTGSVMGNVDPVFDSFEIKERLCSVFSGTMLYDFTFCTNFFQNLSAVSAVSDGKSGSFVKKFDLSPSTLYTISTGVRQCPTFCDENPKANKGVKISSKVSASCLKGQTPDMTVVGRCRDDDAFDIRLPFRFYFLGGSYSDGDVFVGSNSYITFGRSSNVKGRPPIPSLLIGSRDNAMRQVSVGPDPLGWRVRFEGWDSYLSLHRTIQCTRPANVIWEVLFMFNSTIQLCTSSSMNNLDPALNPNSVSAVWDGASFASSISLAPSSMYSISTGLPPCFLHLSLSSPISSSKGSSLTVLLPVNLRLSRHNTVTAVITLHGVGFSAASNTRLNLVISSACNQVTGTANISNSDSVMPLLTVLLQGLANCSVVSFTLPLLASPVEPQDSRTNIRFSVSDANQSVIFTSDSGSLEAIMPPIVVDPGQPVLRLTNNAARSSSTITISLTPKRMEIPASYAPAAFVITLVGAGWNLSETVKGQFVRPTGGNIESVTIATDISSAPVLKVIFSGVFSISNTSSLTLFVFDVTTTRVPQPKAISIRSAILNSHGSIIALGTSGILDAVVASTMGVGSPTVTIYPPVASASRVHFQIILTPQPQDTRYLKIPANVVITLTGTGFTCSTSAIVTFMSPFDALSGAANVISIGSSSIMTIRMTSGTFLSGYPVSLQLGPCSTPSQPQAQMTNVSAAMIDVDGRIVAASNAGTLSEIVEDLSHPSLHLKDNVLNFTYTPRVLVPANSYLVISLTGVGLVCKDFTELLFSQPGSGASGTVFVEGHPLKSIISVSFSTQHSAGTAIVFTASPVYGGCSSNVGNISAALHDKSGRILAATDLALFSASLTSPAVTVQQLINAAANGVIVIPKGTYAGKCNCNNSIDENVPRPKSGTVVEMKGTADRSIIDCSGTGLRCLIVRNTSISVVNVIFKGGSSPVFVSSSTISTVQAIFDKENYDSSPSSYARTFQHKELTRIVRTKKIQRTHVRRILHASKRPFAAHMKLSFRKKPVAGFGAKFEMKHFNRPIQQHAASRTAHLISRGKRGRHLLQFYPERELDMFNVNADESGGCILVLAPTDSVSLSEVTLVRCSAIFGGGGFFNVSNFTAKNSTADGNVARQGGGMFVVASKSTAIEVCNFLNNTVVTTSFSEESPAYLTPDPLWAAGAGIWLQRLTRMKQCVFSNNLALAAKTINGRPRGPHALGSGLFIVQTSIGSVLSDLHFSRSVTLCAGVGCLSTGSMFIALAGLNTSIQALNCSECEVASISTLFSNFQLSYYDTVVAWGTCIAVIDASVGLLKIDKLHSVNNSARSSNALEGGVMYFHYLASANISHISVFGLSLKAKNGGGGVAKILSLKNSIISDVFVNYQRMQISGSSTHYFGLVIQVHCEQNGIIRISSIHVSNLQYVGVNGGLTGGVAHIFQMGTLQLTDISMRDSLFHIAEDQSTRSISSAPFEINGAWINVESDVDATGLLTIRRGLVKNVSSRVEGPQSIQGSFLDLKIDPVTSMPPPIAKLEDLVFQNVSLTCVGEGCKSYGLINVQSENVLSPYRPVHNHSVSLHFSNALFENVQSQCQGTGCSSNSACLTLSVRDAILMDIKLKNTSVGSDGRGSFAAGSFLVHVHNNPTKCMRISNITSEDARVQATGAFSSAIGGVIAALYGNISVDNVRLLRSRVSCSGATCQSIGGSFAFASSLGPSNKRGIFFFAAIANSSIANSIVECSGPSCEATGGAIFAGVSYRGPLEQITGFNGVPPIAFKGIVPLSLIVHISNCMLKGNTIGSLSVGATLSGAGIAILIAGSKITNSVITENVIRSTPLSNFVGGAGIYVSGDNSSASVESSTISHNSAGILGLGGAIFAAPGSTLKCKNVALDFNSAAKGGGLLVDAASVFLVSSTLCNNSATDRGGGIFCVSSSMLNVSATLVLSNVTALDNFLRNNNPGSVGASVYIFGDVLLEVLNSTRFFMNGDARYTTTEAIVSVSRQANISSDYSVLCKSGSVLSVAHTEVMNQKIVLAQPSVQEQYDTQCGPACLFSPEVTPYVASSGFLASCIPCPRGTYSIKSSSDTNDTIDSYCKACPFGAACRGGSDIGALQNYWGWKVSETLLARRFQLLPTGYACERNCSSISPCGGHRTGTLCGGCASNYSVAFFSTECVPSVQCASWKWSALIFMCIAYQVLFSLWMFWSSETEMLQKVSNRMSLAQQVLKAISLFDNLPPDQKDVVASRMELMNVPALTTVIAQGKTSMVLYAIKKGVVNVYIRDAAGNDHYKSSLAPPAVFGELSYINGTKCAASVRTAVDCELCTFDLNCLENVSEAHRASFIQGRQAQYAKPASTKSLDVTDDGALTDAFGVLMWFYQIIGLMLSVTSPLKYLNGSAIFHSLVSFLVNSKPSSQAASEAAASSGTSKSEVGEADASKFQFCVDSSFTMSQLYVTTFMYYVCWAAIMGIFARKRVWRFLRSMILPISLRIAQMPGAVSDCFQKEPKGKEESSRKSLHEEYASRQSADIEIRGPVILKWFVTCFNAVAVLMMQGTACFQLDGFPDAAGSRRWIYDGRVVCFSDDGEQSGIWQVASAFAVGLVFIAPAVLWRFMARIQLLEPNRRSPFQETLLEAYSGSHASNARHWQVVMFYQRLLMMAVSNYLDSAPFYQGYIMLFFCIVILALECTYRPYKFVNMQVLSCTSAAILVAVCGLLLRSQALVSGARSPNFAADDPGIESSEVSSELMPIIVIMIVLLAVPAFIAILLVVRSNLKLKKAATTTQQTKHKPQTQAKDTHKRSSIDVLGQEVPTLMEDDSRSIDHQRISHSNALSQDFAIQVASDASLKDDLVLDVGISESEAFYDDEAEHTSAQAQLFDLDRSAAKTVATINAQMLEGKLQIDLMRKEVEALKSENQKLRSCLKDHEVFSSSLKSDPVNAAPCYKRTDIGSRPSAIEPAMAQNSTNATSSTGSSTPSISQTRPTPRFLNTLLDPDHVEHSPVDLFVSPFGSSTHRVDAFTPLGPSSNTEAFIRKLSPFASHVSQNEGLQQPRSLASPVLLADIDDLLVDPDIMVSEEDKPLPVSLFLNTPSLKHDSALALAGNISSDRFVSPFGSSTRRVDAFTPLGPSSNTEAFIRKLSPFASHVSQNEGLQQPRSLASPVLLADIDDLLVDPDNTGYG